MSFPVDPRARWVLIYRWVVFLLAAGFMIRQLVVAADYGHAGGPFRYLTIWALVLSFVAASRMLALTEGRSEKTWSRLVMVAAVANGLTVLMYWRLWLQDPALVVAGDPLPLWVDYYLHGVGPVLQWIDVLFIYGGFRRPMRAVLPFLGVALGYLAWVELFVGPFNDFPVGPVTDGLPYPFLNALEPAARLQFYGVTVVTGLVILGLFAGLAWGIRQLQPTSAARSAESPDR
ncbi:androgen-induced gene 1 family protein [Ovoidimarina sediminis]|uniref:hypothetical protein n=1 Tax=Ovoidimarina sediminis TaxID=3079856 RepID=UPI0029143DEA|nr:hypothetical protein [Rhodophyticola sp. MJ-SS7]MDU8942345.1 hypothetical protein [Rhodophyticola sp. MJ-SS7]